MIAQFGMVVANNGLSGGMDISSLLPRYFTIRRGMLLLAVISFIVQPWQLLNGASKFLTVLGGYGVFLGPMTGIMYADYFIVRRRLFKLTDLYAKGHDSVYYYWRGLNWRAPIAWIMGIWLTLPGFARQVQGGQEMEGWSHLYYMSWPLGACVSMLTYYVLHRVAPMPGTGETDGEDYFGVGGFGAPVFIEGTDGTDERAEIVVLEKSMAV